MTAGNDQRVSMIEHRAGGDGTRFPSVASRARPEVRRLLSEAVQQFIAYLSCEQQDAAELLLFTGDGEAVSSSG
jgi:hypothetical protein